MSNMKENSSYTYFISNLMTLWQGLENGYYFHLYWTRKLFYTTFVTYRPIVNFE